MSAVAINNQLRQHGISADETAVLLKQHELRQKAKLKFGDIATEMLFTDAGLQQASRLLLAEHHAKRFIAAGAAHVYDLGCGIGAQSMAFAGGNLSTTSVEIDALTAAIARHNVSLTSANNPSNEVLVADATAIKLAKASAVFLDPARRAVGHTESRRFSSVNQYSPSIEFAFNTANAHPTAIKLGPGFERDLIPAGVEAQWISVNGELLENVLWFGDLKRQTVGRSALVFKATSQGVCSYVLEAEADTPNAAVRQIGQYIYEPDPAIIRARLIGKLADSLHAGMLDQKIAYMTGDQKIDTPFATGFRVLDQLPTKPKQLSAALNRLEVGAIEIKKRGVDTDPHLLRKQLKLKTQGNRALVLFLTRIGQKHVCYLAERT